MCYVAQDGIGWGGRKVRTSPATVEGRDAATAAAAWTCQSQVAVTVAVGDVGEGVEGVGGEGGMSEKGEKRW